MRILWVSLISGAAFIAGGLGMFTVKASTSFVAGFPIACAMFQAADSGGVFSKEQRIDIVARLLKKPARSNDEAQSFWARGCLKG